ncbi:alpha-hydroxy acid oxidase [Pollutimonas bauzanensis]|uniref:Lactate oxidase n=1 Tax=Pollutimonas bauzanensis TaxID=658167 RepID=A0A1M5MLK6_9BURK|nr:alpha-hydroxy acid oxidase [Pollutimonas bauzanensis]SHG78198.1 lactate oxidase [Pollutimonas bauzanensis]
MNITKTDAIAHDPVEPQNRARRDMLRLAGAGFATAALSASGLARAQVAEEANTESLMIERKGIDKDIKVFNIDLLEEQAKQKYGHGTYVFVSHGSGDQWTLAENRRAFGDYVFTPQRMQGIVREKIDTSVTLLGEKLPHPVIVTPFGSHGLHHPAGEVATAEGAARSGALLTVSSASTRSMEDIAKASTGPKWFQMYLNVDEGLSKEVLQRARDAGFKAIVLTIDAIGQGSSDEYMRLGNPRPWLPYGNFTTGSANAFKTNLSWSDVEMIRKITGLPVIVKGVTRPEDAVAAVKAGAAAIQVSNHGGRALDGTPAAIAVLPEVAQALQGDAPIIMDSGIRRGTDIVKALALGADAVAIGRPLMYGLAVGGAGGVNSVMEFMQRELVNTVLHSGVDSIAKLDATHVWRAGRT